MHQNLPASLAESARVHADLPASRIRTDFGWRVRTFAQVQSDIRRLAASFIGRGLQPGDRVALFSPNRPEWTITDLAVVSAGAILVPIYQTSTPEQIAHIVRDSGARWLVASGASEVERVEAARPDLPSLTDVFTIDRVGDLPTIQDLIDEGGDEDAVDARIAAQQTDDVMTIIYTSGTTGAPKGAMLTHRTYLHQFDAIDAEWNFTTDDHSLCFLPLSHAYERIWTYYLAHLGCMNTYVMSPKTIAEQMVEAKATMMTSVPMLFERVYQVAHKKVADDPIKRRILRWALRVGGRLQRDYRAGRRPSLYWKAQLPLADKLVLKSIRDAVGGPKSLLVSGGAPLRQEVEEFFSAAGILLGQGYGLTETGPMITLYNPSNFKLGTVGRPILGAEFKLGEGGEVLVKAPSIMKGYWNNPEATAEVIDADGWFHTGDVGYIDTDGFVVITDRLKDIIVTANGKNIAPQPIEARLAADPLIELAVLLGNDRPCLTLLVQPSLPDLEALATSLRITWERAEDLINNPQIVAEITRRVTDATAKLASHEQIRDLRVLLSEITLENGLLTPTLKVKRREVEKKFAGVIDEMYAAISRRRGR